MPVLSVQRTVAHPSVSMHSKFFTITFLLDILKADRARETDTIDMKTSGMFEIIIPIIPIKLLCTVYG